MTLYGPKKLRDDRFKQECTYLGVEIWPIVTGYEHGVVVATLSVVLSMYADQVEDVDGFLETVVETIKKGMRYDG